MVFDVVSREGKPLCAMGTCALCEKTKPLHRLEVWKGPEQRVVVCELCFDALEEILGAKEAA